jgi:hypothetical protein
VTLNPLWFALFMIVLPGFFISVEWPVWAFKATKTIRYIFALDRDQPISSIIRLVIFILTIIVLEVMYHYIVIIMLWALLSVITLVSVLKILNTLLPPHKQSSAIVRIVDCYIYEVPSSESTTITQWAVCMISAPNLGVRVFPVFCSDNMATPRPNMNLSVSYRVGGLGLIYRFSFDEI